jgi:hypothetical protein
MLERIILKWDKIMTISERAFVNNLIESLKNGSVNITTDDNGQLIILTSIYQWVDGSIHDRCEIDLDQKAKWR